MTFQPEPDFAVGQVVDQAAPVVVPVIVIVSFGSTLTLIGAPVVAPVRRLTLEHAGTRTVGAAAGGVGAAVGAAVGATVGVAVGAGVGTAVGAAVGVAVGRWRCRRRVQDPGGGVERGHAVERESRPSR